MSNLLYLDDKLKYWISQLNLKFTYNNCIMIDLFDYFPLLKQGKTCDYIIHTIIHIYTLFYRPTNIEFLDTQILEVEDKLFFDTFGCDINMFFYNNKYKQTRKDQHINRRSLLDKLSLSHIERCNRTEYLIKQLALESTLIDKLSFFIFKMKKPFNLSLKTDDNNNLPHNLLCELLLSPVLSDSILLHKLLLDDNVGLIYAILNNDTNKIYEYLYVNCIDPRLGNNELYKLALNLKTTEISNMIKHVSIVRNLLEKQILTDNFTELIGVSNVSDNIFNYLNNFR